MCLLFAISLYLGLNSRRDCVNANGCSVAKHFQGRFCVSQRFRNRDAEAKIACGIRSRCYWMSTATEAFSRVPAQIVDYKRAAIETSVAQETGRLKLMSDWDSGVTCERVAYLTTTLRLTFALNRSLSEQV